MSNDYSALRTHLSHIDELLDEMVDVHGIDFYLIEESEKAPEELSKAFSALDAYWVLIAAKCEKLEKKEANT